MESQISNAGFDELAKEAAADLLQQFWILRRREPEKYQLVRRREETLRKWFWDKAGLRLVVHRHFAKLEKVPAVPLPWMGIPDFTSTRDYTIFCCLLAFLEGLAVEEQFLLSQLCEELQSLYPETGRLDWTNYEHRKSLVRVMRVASEFGLLLVVDGEVDQFSRSEAEVLYEVTPVVRYFLRNLPHGLQSLDDPVQLLESDLAADPTVRRRHRIYRQLLFCPVIHRSDDQDPDFLYLRNYRSRLREDLEQNFDFQFDLFRNASMLTLPERFARYRPFPGSRVIEDIAVQFAGLAREHYLVEDIPLQYDGSLCLPEASYLAWVQECRQRYARGWSKEYREKDLNEVARDLLDLLLDWQLAAVEPGTGTVCLRSALARFSGSYPADFAGPEEGLEE